MKAKEIKELISFIANSGLDEVDIETEEIKLRVKKQSQSAATTIVEKSVPVVQQPVVVPQETTLPPTKEKATEESPKEDTSNYVTIKSPMIGTFYRSASPEADAFVNVGDNVATGNVVCIIEAMKLFNEIESEISGKIVKVLVENASPVEYDQPLFLVDPS